jgi:hypothetical protein
VTSAPIVRSLVRAAREGRLVRATRERAVPLSVLALGAVIALGAQLASPIAVPLYDGVPTLEPYRYLAPTGSQPGNPASYADQKTLVDGSSPAFAAATTEQPPQAQLISAPKAFVPPAGATEMNVTIDAVPPDETPAEGSIAGNVYRIQVLDENGADFQVTGDPKPTLTLRAPENVADAVIGHLTADGWVALATEHGGALGIFSTDVSELGDFAVLVGVSPPSDLARLAIILGTIALPLVVAIAYFYRRARRDQRSADAAAAARAKARVPSKRRKRR